jgi:uncharacterized lipoprotein YddW (UPF0748 family)
MKRFLFFSYWVVIIHIVFFVQAQKRAMWVVRDGLKDTKSIDQIITTAIQLNISDIFLQVRALGRLYYNSKKEPIADGITKNFDPLLIAIEKAHRNNIKIHAWFNVFYVWSGDMVPGEENHCFNKYTNFILRKDKFPEYKELKKEGIEGFFLDPEAGEVKQYLIDLIRELISNYPVDGIHLDYFRYPDVKFSFTPQSRTEFMLVNHFDPYILYSSADNYVKTRGFEAYLYVDEIYRNSLVENLSLFIEEIYKSIKNIKAEVELSVAVKPDPIQAKHRYFQDWISWINKSYCDFLVIMNYRRDLAEFLNILSKIKDHTSTNSIMVGISTYNQNEEAVKKRIEIVKSSKFAGFSLFSYNHLIKNRKYLLNLY